MAVSAGDVKLRRPNLVGFARQRYVRAGAAADALGEPLRKVRRRRPRDWRAEAGGQRVEGRPQSYKQRRQQPRELAPNERGAMLR